MSFETPGALKRKALLKVKLVRDVAYNVVGIRSAVTRFDMAWHGILARGKTKLEFKTFSIIESDGNFN